MKQKGFTLAEMLIALALIGVIAALLIPKLLSSVGNRQDVAKVRAMVSTVERAVFEGTNDPDSNLNQTFAQFIEARVNGSTVAPATVALDCTQAAAGAAATTGLYFPDGTALFVTGAGTLAANPMSGTTAQGTVCIEMNAKSNTTDGYSGTFAYNAAKRRYEFAWNAAAAGGATANAASILY